MQLSVYCSNTTCNWRSELGGGKVPLKSSKTKAGRSSRSARLGLRTTDEQVKILRRAAEASHKSLTDFILDSAYQAAEKTLLDQRLFVVSGNQYQALLDMLERPAKNNARLKRLFSKPSPWKS